MLPSAGSALPPFRFYAAPPPPGAPARAASDATPAGPLELEAVEHFPFEYQAAAVMYRVPGWPQGVVLRVHLGADVSLHYRPLPHELELWRSREGWWSTSPQDPPRIPTPAERAQRRDWVYAVVLEALGRYPEARQRILALSREQGGQGTDVEVLRHAVGLVLAADERKRQEATSASRQEVASAARQEATLRAAEILRNAKAVPQAPVVPAPDAAPDPVLALAEWIREGKWNSTAGDIAPMVATRLAQWPKGRALVILHPNGPATVCGGTTAPGKSSVQVRLAGNHYSALRDGKVLEAGGHGACFFRATTLSMGADAAVFGGNGTPPWLGLRNAVADYVATHPEYVAPFLCVDEEAPAPVAAPAPAGKTRLYTRTGAP